MEEHYNKVRMHQHPCLAEIHCQLSWRTLGPHGKGFAQGLEAVKPHAATAWEHAGKAHVTLRAKLLEGFAVAKARTEGALKEAGPTAKALLARTQVIGLLLLACAPC